MKMPEKFMNMLRTCSNDEFREVVKTAKTMAASDSLSDSDVMRLMNDGMRFDMVRDLLNDYFKGKTDASAEAVLHEINNILYTERKR